jgi:hypothetical protein
VDRDDTDYAVVPGCRKEVIAMPQGAPARKEKKKPKKDAAAKAVRSTIMDQTPAPAVEVIGKRRKQREEVD